MHPTVLLQPDDAFRLGDFLQSSLRDRRWTHFRAAVAFVKYSGTKHISQALGEFAARSEVTISVGIDAGGTSVEGLTDLLNAMKAKGDIWVFKNANNSTFHPKVYLFKNNNEADLIVGSGNLTEGGLFTNYEASVRLRLDLSNAEHAALVVEVEKALDYWSTSRKGLCYRLTADFLSQLIAREEVLTEAQARETEEGRRPSSRRSGQDSPFQRLAVRPAPRVSKQSDEVPEEVLEGEQEGLLIKVPLPARGQRGHNWVFLMTLQRTDVGMGQVTKGTSRRSPEVFIPLSARQADPDFWGWPAQFTADKRKRGKMDRFGVKMRIGTSVIEVNMMTWPDKHDFRLRSERLRSAGNEGDILYMERSDGSGGFTYYVEVIPVGTAKHAAYLAKCVNSVRGSKRLWGYL